MVVTFTPADFDNRPIVICFINKSKIVLAPTAAVGDRVLHVVGVRELIRMRVSLSLIALAWVQFGAADTSSELATGTWASGETIEACSEAPISLFMSDGVVAVFVSRDGDLHSLGSWVASDDTLTMTHNDFPLSGDGQSKPPVELAIVELSDTRFVTRNADAEERVRVRCPDIVLALGQDGHGHH